MQGTSSQGKINILQAEFQADLVICSTVLKGECEFELSVNSDFHFICGEQCISIKSLALCGQPTAKTISKIVLHCSHTQPLQKLAQTLNIDSTSQLKESSIPILEGAPTKLCLAIAVVVGCDPCPGGVMGIGLSQVAKILNEGNNVDTSYNSLVAKAMDHGVDIHTPSEVMMYEPCNLQGQPVTKEDYLFGKPNVLPQYLKEFACDDVVVAAGPPMEQCSAYGDGPHPFFAAEGINECGDCKEKFCQFCTI